MPGKRAGERAADGNLLDMADDIGRQHLALMIVNAAGVALLGTRWTPVGLDDR